MVLVIATTFKQTGLDACLQVKRLKGYLRRGVKWISIGEHKNFRFLILSTSLRIISSSISCYCRKSQYYRNLIYKHNTISIRILNIFSHSLDSRLINRVYIVFRRSYGFHSRQHTRPVFVHHFHRNSVRYLN